MKTTVLLLAALTGAAPLTACGPGDAVVREPVAITYEAHGCYGRCPVYRVTVRADGSGTFFGRQHVTAIGERPFTMTREQFARLRDYLAPARPRRGSIPREGETSCNMGDGETLVVTWEGAEGARQSYCAGSHGEGSSLAEDRVRNVRRHLPIAELIGPR